MSSKEDTFQGLYKTWTVIDRIVSTKLAGIKIPQKKGLDSFFLIAMRFIKDGFQIDE